MLQAHVAYSSEILHGLLVYKNNAYLNIEHDIMVTIFSRERVMLLYILLDVLNVQIVRNLTVRDFQYKIGPVNCGK